MNNLNNIMKYGTQIREMVVGDKHYISFNLNPNSTPEQNFCLSELGNNLSEKGYEKTTKRNKQGKFMFIYRK